MQTTRTPANRHARPPAGPAGRALIAITAAALIALGVAGCDDEDEVLAVLPITADITIPGDLSVDPLVYFERVAAAGDTVTMRAMLRTTTPYAIDSINLEINFDSGLAQVISQFDGAATPFGNCNGPAACDPTCVNNCDTSGGGGCNVSGRLIIGISRDNAAACTSYSANTGPAGVPILTLGFRAATLGSSPIELVDLPGVTGDCEILHWEPAGADPPITQHPIPCDDGGATLTATR